MQYENTGEGGGLPDMHEYKEPPVVVYASRARDAPLRGPTLSANLAKPGATSLKNDSGNNRFVYIDGILPDVYVRIEGKGVNKIY